MPKTKYVTKTGPATPFTERGLSSDRYDVGMYTEMKGGNDFSTPLTSRSLAILEKMDERRSACDSKFIFPGQYGRRLGSSNLLNLSNRLTKDTDLQTSIHGLRSTMRTWIGEMGYDFAVGESQLDHTVGTAATRAYTYSAEYLGRRL